MLVAIASSVVGDSTVAVEAAMLGRVPLARGAVFVEWVGGACGRKVKFGSTYSISLYGNINGLFISSARYY